MITRPVAARSGAVALSLAGALALGCATPAPGPQPITAAPAATTTPTPPAPAPVSGPASSPASGPASAPASVPAAAPAAAGLKQVFPHVRVDVEARRVEVDARVAIDAHDPETPRVYLELVACSPDSREHESLVVSPARPAHVHAALLMIGLLPGRPGAVRWDGQRHVAEAPTGAGLSVRLRPAAAPGAGPEADAQQWIIDAETGRTFPGELPAGAASGWVFAGSRQLVRQQPDGVQRLTYDADMAGTVVGLATFGSETVSWSGVFSPDVAITPARWIADRRRVPPVGTAVTIVLAPAPEQDQNAGTGSPPPPAGR